MARLNTTKPPKINDPRLRPNLTLHTDQTSASRTPRRASAAGTKEAKQRPLGGETWTQSKTVGTTTRPAPQKSRSQRSGKNSGGSFDIFYDGDATSEGEENESGTRVSNGSEGEIKSPLTSAKVNSLLLAVPQQARSRPTRKSEVDYDKENDPVEEDVEDGYELANTRRREPTGRAQNLPETPRGNGNGRQFWAYREPETGDEGGEGSEDNGFDSLDDFIVSDNEELSQHETSEAETEDEVAPPPPPPSRRRLFKGRRPGPETEVENELGPPLQKNELPLEPSLPSGLTIPSLMSDSQQKEMSQNGLNIAEKMDHLSLENNDVSSQLETDLCRVVDELDSPSDNSTSEEPSLETPPSSPSKHRFLSPTKRKVQVPPTPHRESADGFWSQELTNDWVDQHSPCKLQQLVQELEESDVDTSDTMLRARRRGTPKTPSKTALRKAETEQKKAAQARKKAFDAKKVAFAEEFLNVLDDAVSGGQVRRLAAETGGVKIVWSKTLQKTAGRANWKRSRTPNPAGPTTTPRHHAFIELAERVIDDEDRLINTLAHEYCHLANFMVSNVPNNPHGASFKQWGRRCKEAMMDHPVYGGRIEVTTKHRYKIDFKYVWACVDCGQTCGRHSKSIDTTRFGCGACKGALQQIKPKPRNVSPKKQQQSPERRAVEDMTKDLGDVLVL